MTAQTPKITSRIWRFLMPRKLQIAHEISSGIPMNRNAMNRPAKMNKIGVLVAAVILTAFWSGGEAKAQHPEAAAVVANCGTPPYPYVAGSTAPITQDTTGAGCTNNSGAGGITQVTPIAPDVSSVTTGGTAVTAFNAGHVAKGGWLFNPNTATANLCINIVTTATTTGTGSTACIAPGQSYTIPATTGAISVNSSDSSHGFAGAGYT